MKVESQTPSLTASAIGRGHGWKEGAKLGTVREEKKTKPEHQILVSLRWAKSRDSYRRMASESYRCDSNR